MKVKTADLTKYRREYMRQYRKDNPEKIAALQRQNYVRTVEQRRAYGKARYAEKRESHLRMKYRIEMAEYDAMHAAQGGKCAICAADKTNGRGKTPSLFHVDHCHAAGKVRGLLCNSCNRMLGLGRDDPALLRAGAAYLELTAEKKSS